jgi:hypothetical protein
MKIWCFSVLLAQSCAANPVASLHRHLDNVMSDLDTYADSRMHPRAALELDKIHGFVKQAFGIPSKSTTKTQSQPTRIRAASSLRMA